MARVTNQKTPDRTTDSPRARRAIDARTWVLGLLIVASALGVAALAYVAHTTTAFSFDVPVTRAVQQFNPPWFDVLMRTVNWMGFGLQAVSLVSAVVAIMFLAGWRLEALIGALDAAGIWALNLGIAHIVNRPNPAPGQFGDIFLDLTAPSFPSGHVTSYIGIYGFAWYLVYTRVRQPWLRLPLLVVLGALVLLVSPSRVYMGRHWPSDVLASVLLGLLWLILTLGVYAWSKRRVAANERALGLRNGPALRRSQLE
jgi:membrane-associated phospholipid phosphatase